MKYNKRQQKKQFKKYLANKFGAKGKELNVMYKGLTSFDSSSSKTVHDVLNGNSKVVFDEDILSKNQIGFLYDSINTKNILIRPKTIEGSKLNKILNIK
ncbi:hypothetical protein [Francisella philomiragia]|uniref:hypothetical protein n=1 Tax=Francisella philomiragia TaxID=28110 RepID=UPI001902FFAC|nr:hypothetical protein [Francisella philomiragia]MBK2257564.1 hypothetical protein [Francisella philomiragia]MBK2270274.1 hypothetical protein [Francisella philomiragia]MBK2272120.1 hypothetical protein [Francisella philomiragia]MBK2275959.1 hypothetical protein [Francisella philomiragia]MBK2295460.1 hypothetical protein [Francisella philomiragia]